MGPTILRLSRPDLSFLLSSIPRFSLSTDSSTLPFPWYFFHLCASLTTLFFSLSVPTSVASPLSSILAASSYRGSDSPCVSWHERRRRFSRVPKSIFAFLVVYLCMRRNRHRKSGVAMAGGNEVNASESRMVVPLNTFVLISNFKVAYNMLRRPDGSFDRHLDEFLDRKVQSNASPVNGVVSFDRLLDRKSNLLARIYCPTPSPLGNDLPQLAALYDLQRGPSSEPFPVIIFFHGGSFAHSTASSAIYDTLCRRFVTLCGGAVVISVDYRRSPEYRFPCAYDDGWVAFEWAASQPWLRSGKDAKLRVFLSGDSSGGNIAHHVAVRAVESGIHVSGNILLNPLFGGNRRTESELRLDGKYFVALQDRDWYWRAFLPQGADRDHPACNPFGPNGVKLDGLPFPKTLLVVASLDMTQDWQLAYEEGLRRAGHDVKLLYREQATIGFYFLPNTHHYHEVMEEIRSFVRSGL